MKFFHSFLALFAGASLVGAFAPLVRHNYHRSSMSSSTNNPIVAIAEKATTATTTTQLFLTADEIPADLGEARTAFFVWFFGASGAAGIARGAFPRMYNNTQTIKKLEGVGPTKGGDTVGLSSLCAYPVDLSIADINQILNNKLSIEQIVAKYPVEGNFLAAKGYLTFSAYEQANKGCNPLTLRAIFDCFSQSTDVVNPIIAQQKVDAYKENLGTFKNDLLKSKLQGYMAIITLLGLLGLADIVAFGHAYDGWFPEWPGGRENLPWGLIDPQTGPWTIPNYWL
mmetsp:Transcript_12241/g.17076  ORF Transcript_12241/g.17076 Transcript_12241/m.17076 type:complete len:283 (+) Transcript_12241:117-965(+)